MRCSIPWSWPFTWSLGFYGYSKFYWKNVHVCVGLNEILYRFEYVCVGLQGPFLYVGLYGFSHE